LVIRRDPDGKLTFTLLNDPADTELETLVRASCQRHWVERVIEDGKLELGWDDFCARRYLAWEHHVALTAAALWFIAQVKLGWKESYAGPAFEEDFSTGGPACPIHGERARPAPSGTTFAPHRSGTSPQAGG
jgi:hypothetical protein